LIPLFAADRKTLHQVNPPAVAPTESLEYNPPVPESASVNQDSSGTVKLSVSETLEDLNCSTRVPSGERVHIKSHIQGSNDLKDKKHLFKFGFIPVSKEDYEAQRKRWNDKDAKHRAEQLRLLMRQ
jgi:hypothetical protein